MSDKPKTDPQPQPKDNRPKMVVVAPFGDYQVGDVIPDADRDAVMAGDNRLSVVVSPGDKPNAS